MAYRGTISWRSGVTVFKYYSLSSGRLDLGCLANVSRIGQAVALYSGAKGASCCENRPPDVTRKMGLTRVQGKAASRAVASPLVAPMARRKMDRLGRVSAIGGDERDVERATIP